MKLPRAAVTSIILLLLGPTAPASAEWFADLYAGLAVTGSRDITVANDPSFRNVEFNRPAGFGGRVGYWLEDFEYIGFGLDALHYQPDINAQIANSTIGLTRFDRLDLNVTALSVEVLLRYPLWRSEGFPHGRLQLYGLIGPIAAIAGDRHDKLRSTSRTIARFNSGGIQRRHRRALATHQARRDLWRVSRPAIHARLQLSRVWERAGRCEHAPLPGWSLGPILRCQGVPGDDEERRTDERSRADGDDGPASPERRATLTCAQWWG